MSAILILEDDLDLALQWFDALADRGHTVVHASNVDEALLAWDAAPFNTVIVDLFIRSGSGEIIPQGGVSFLASIRLDAADRKTRVQKIVISGAESIGIRDGALAKTVESLGVDHALAKPIALQDLISVVETGRMP